jgi:anaerobic selenocysteine-containing dehydrogenase
MSLFFWDNASLEMTWKWDFMPVRQKTVCEKNPGSPALSSKDFSSGEENIVRTSCSYDCGARCVLKVHVKDGVIARIGTDERPMPSLKACIRGLAQKDVVYAPDRITKPLKRVGAKGEGRFEPISWDDALERVSKELLRVRAAYGNPSIFLVDYSGSISPLQGFGRASRRFFSLFGGCTATWGITSYEAALFSALATFGTVYTGATKDNFLHSRLILLWGFDPVVTRFGPDTVHWLGRAKKAGARIVCVDPRLNHTGKAMADDWIAIRPGTDAAMMIAMAFVMIAENLHDRISSTPTPTGSHHLQTMFLEKKTAGRKPRPGLNRSPGSRLMRLRTWPGSTQPSSRGPSWPAGPPGAPLTANSITARRARWPP